MLNFQALAADLLPRARDLLPQWFPAGAFKGHEYEVGNLAGAAGSSLKINCNSGLWSDFSSGDKGGDLISLYAAAHGLDQLAAAKQLANGAAASYEVPSGAPPPRPPPKARQVVAPAPSEAPARTFQHAKHGEPTQVWTYRDAESRVMGYVARYDPPGAKKEIIPYTFAADRWSAGQWNEPRPLYGLDALAAAPASPVLIVEGEKACDAARAIVGTRYVVITWPGGSQAWRKVDWSPVSGRRVLLWADADKKAWDDKEAARLEVVEGELKPAWLQPGNMAMAGIGKILAPLCSEVKALDVATAGPGNDGWDLFDAKAEGWGWEQLVAWAKPRAVPFADAAWLTGPEPTRRAPVAAAEAPAPPQPEERPEEPPPIAEAPPEAAVDAPPPTSKRKPRATRDIEYHPWEGRPWGAQMICTERGQPKPLLANAIAALLLDPDWQGVLAYDTFAMRTLARRDPPVALGCPDGEWTDVHDSLTAAWLQHHGVAVGKQVAAQAIEAVARQNAFHPVRDYLESVTWDGTARIEHWLTDFCAAEDSLYTRSVGSRWLIAAVARIMRPGCKVDNALIFESPQGKRKSTALRVLGGKWFSDDNSEMGSKDSKQEMQGVWIMELAELSNIANSTIETIKAFISRQIDRFRAAYAARVLEAPRQAVFGGSVNRREYLQDEENRRFWPVLVAGRINIPGLEGVRDQLWAEALHRFQAGERWWIDDELDADLASEAREQQEMRRVADEWENLVTEWIASQSLMTPMQEVTLGQLLEHAIKLPADRWSRPEQNRVARILKGLGWERFQKRTGMRRVYAYRSPNRPVAPEQRVDHMEPGRFDDFE